MKWLFVVLFAAVVALPASSQPSDACRISCGANMNPVPPTLRQCLARCAAGEAFSQRNPEPPPAQQAPAMLAPTPPPAVAPPAVARPVALTPAPSVAATPPPAARSREPAPVVEAPRLTPPANPAPAQASGPPAGTAPRAPLVAYGALSLATQPRMNFGISVGQRDRISAQQAAELACRASGASCAPVLDFAEPCIAVAEGVRRVPGALFMTSDSRTYRVFAVTPGVATNPADAERIAVDACVARDRSLTCRVAQAACGPR